MKGRERAGQSGDAWQQGYGGHERAAGLAVRSPRMMRAGVCVDARIPESTWLAIAMGAGMARVSEREVVAELLKLAVSSGLVRRAVDNLK